MKTIRQVSKILTNGKVVKTEEVSVKASSLADPKPVVKKVMDSTADALILRSEYDLRQAKGNESNSTIVCWEEVKEVAAPKAVTPKVKK